MEENADLETPGNSLGASTSNEEEGRPIKGRSGVVGSDKGSVFLVGFRAADSKSRKIPQRLQEYQKNKKTTTESDILLKQKLAEERKKKYDDNKVRQARKAREEAERFDKKVRTIGENQRKWYGQALPK